MAGSLFLLLLLHSLRPSLRKGFNLDKITLGHSWIESHSKWSPVDVRPCYKLREPSFHPPSPPLLSPFRLALVQQGPWIDSEKGGGRGFRENTASQKRFSRSFPLRRPIVSSSTRETLHAPSSNLLSSPAIPLAQKQLQRWKRFLYLCLSHFLSLLRAKLLLNFKRCALCVPSCVPEADDGVSLRGSGVGEDGQSRGENSRNACRIAR